MTTEEVAILLAALLAGSEILATLPSFKANSWIQLFINILKRGVKQ